MKIEHLNATFQPAKIGHPHGLQVTYLKDNSTRNIFVYHEDGKVGAGPGAAPPPPSRGRPGWATRLLAPPPRPHGSRAPAGPAGRGTSRGPRAGAPRGQQLAGLAQRLPAPPAPGHPGVPAQRGRGSPRRTPPGLSLGGPSTRGVGTAPPQTEGLPAFSCIPWAAFTQGTVSLA